MTLAHGAIVLAAGASMRLGRPKQLVEIDGEPLVRRIARAALATAPVDCVVVVGHEAERIAGALDGLELRTLVITDFADGMAASLRAGVAALDAACDGALIVLTDQPALTSTHLAAICKTWQAAPHRAVASTYDGVLGVPALLPRSWFGDVAAVRGDVGARNLLRRRVVDVVAIAADDLARDIDTPDDLADI